MLVANLVKSSVWKWKFTKALAWAPYCSSYSFAQDAHVCRYASVRSPTETLAPCGWRVSEQTPLFVEAVPDGSTCIGISGTMKLEPDLMCKRSSGLARPVDGIPVTEVTVGREKLDVVHPSTISGTAYPEVAVVNLLPSQDVVLHWANSMSPNTPPHPHPSPPLHPTHPTHPHPTNDQVSL